ncbi:carotenoid 9,10(9',10')-cleavage dioxygenase 1-like [Ziziphus jujuba]|uniref:Carotenoid 9,10(9',10')-cleavage dioxygenase 1-like n=1 Tax=Ziziphus jujuba TaxID=326968 RepID=A0A6P6G7S1_ZIZJJ|nr:carotenoid 9,10(9',10')-cleavage dioxygenase 1 [Ziziphus jujuba]XP_060672625.1 carotenoid 9,10(9',10')-cleavage dioxygenase 1-like [Ziziphus jujuba]
MAAVGVEEKTHENGGGIVVVNPKPNKGVTSKLVDWVETLIVKFMYDPSQPLHYLSGNFAPVPNQTPPTEDLPDCLNGEFVRVGPNKIFSANLILVVKQFRY